jgi:uncharacterized membrane protein YbhN (UPF0104 family)
MEANPGGSQKAKHWRILSLVFFFVLTVLAIFLLPWKETWQALRSVDVKYIIVAFTLAIPMQIFMTYTYKLILEGQNAHINYLHLLLINMGMSFYDIVLPSTFIGSGLRWMRYSQQSHKPAQSFVSIAFYKVFNIFLALILSLAFLIFSDVTSLRGHIWQIIIVLLVIVVIMLVTPWVSRQLVKRLTAPPLNLQTNKILTKAWVYVFKIIQAFAEFEQLKITTQLAIIVMGITNHLIMYVSYLLFARSVGVDLTFAQLGAMRALLVLAMNLPINFGIGINLKDLTLLAILTAMGVALDKAVAISVIAFARVLFTGILGGFAELFNILFVNKEQTPVPINNKPGK